MASKPQNAPRKGSRKSFKRVHVPRLERTASTLVLILLLGIGVAIWQKGRHFDPHLYSLRPDALKSTAGAPEPTPVLKAESEQNIVQKNRAADYANAESEQSAPTTSANEPLEIPGTVPMGKTEFYSADNLYEKIDGRSPAYLGFHFQQLRCRSFTVKEASGSFVDVLEFKMATPLDAFGIFSLERDPKGQPLNFAADGYSGEQGFFFRTGQHYVQIIASDQDPKTIALALNLAQQRAKSLPADDSGLAARRCLPLEGLVAESVRFVPENAQGQSFLKEVFEATYQFEGTSLPYFAMASTPDEAAAAFEAYKKFCGRFGGKVSVLPETGGARIFQAENFGTWKVVFQRNGEIGGVYDSTDGAKALQFVERHLKQQANP